MVDEVIDMVKNELDCQEEKIEKLKNKKSLKDFFEEVEKSTNIAYFEIWKRLVNEYKKTYIITDDSLVEVESNKMIKPYDLDSTYISFATYLFEAREVNNELDNDIIQFMHLNSVNSYGYFPINIKKLCEMLLEDNLECTLKQNDKGNSENLHVKINFKQLENYIISNTQNQNEKEIFLCKVEDIKAIKPSAFANVVSADWMLPKSINYNTCIEIHGHNTILIHEKDDIFIEYYSGERIRMYDDQSKNYISSILLEYYKKYEKVRNCNNQIDIDSSLFVDKSALTKIDFNDPIFDETIIANENSKAFLNDFIEYMKFISKSSKENILDNFEKKPIIVPDRELDDAFVENAIYNIKTYGKYKPIMYKHD